jgi:hypothetical protein
MYTLIDAYKNLSTSTLLEKLAENGDSALQEKIALARAALDDELFYHVKAAGWLPASRLARGALLATGAAVPIGMAGYWLKNQITDTGDELRNRIIQTALALAGVGAGLYGLHRATTDEKEASDEQEYMDEAITKLATVGVIEGILDALPDTLSEDAQKLAAEIRILNRGYGTQLLRELSNV